MDTRIFRIRRYFAKDKDSKADTGDVVSDLKAIFLNR